MIFNGVWDYFKTKLAQSASARVATLQNSASEQSQRQSQSTDNTPNYRTALTAALLKRMYAFCKANDIKFILLDIPARTEHGGVESGFSAALAESIEQDRDAFVASKPLLEPFTGQTTFFLPHGTRHISRFTHTQLGIATAKEIELLLSADHAR